MYFLVFLWVVIWWKFMYHNPKLFWSSVVCEPSCCLSVFILTARCILPAAILYIALQGLVTEVRLQNSFYDLLFSCLMSAAYCAFEARYNSFLCSLNSLLSFVLWYLRLFAFTSFLCIVSLEDHHGIDLCFSPFPFFPACLNEVRHAWSIISWSLSTASSIFSSLPLFVLAFHRERQPR